MNKSCVESGWCGVVILNVEVILIVELAKLVIMVEVVNAAVVLMKTNFLSLIKR